MIPKSRIETRNFLKLVFSRFTVETLAIFDQYPRKYITHLYLRRKEFWRQHVTFQTHNNLLTAITISFLQYRGWSAHYTGGNESKSNKLQKTLQQKLELPESGWMCRKYNLLPSFVPLGHNRATPKGAHDMDPWQLSLHSFWKIFEILVILVQRTNT